jgi:ribosome-associated protein
MSDGLEVAPGVVVPLAEIELRASRSSGPGGQHANVTASRVEASLDIAGSTAFTDEQRERLIARLGTRVSAVAQDARGQARNRAKAPPPDPADSRRPRAAPGGQAPRL